MRLEADSQNPGRYNSPQLTEISSSKFNHNPESQFLNSKLYFQVPQGSSAPYVNARKSNSQITIHCHHRDVTHNLKLGRLGSSSQLPGFQS